MGRWINYYVHATVGWLMKRGNLGHTPRESDCRQMKRGGAAEGEADLPAGVRSV